MKQQLLNRITEEESRLNDEDAEGHIWWNRFRELVEEMNSETDWTNDDPEEKYYRGYQTNMDSRNSMSESGDDSDLWSTNEL